MRPAFSVVFLTTLIGAGQGLFIALFVAERVGTAPAGFKVTGAAISVALAALGLVASFFHLGRPERAWRTAAMWRTSWLSREVIALPLFMAATAAYGYGALSGWAATPAIAFVALACCLALFYCTAMIYACVRFLQEWASPYTIANFFLMGSASGITLAAALAALQWRPMVVPYAILSILLTAAALATRVASLARNSRVRHRSTVQSAIGVREAKVRQVSMGFTGSSFNTREFFHGASSAAMARIPVAFVALAFVAPILLVALGAATDSSRVLGTAFVVQYAGLLLERWFFLAQANHPQNLYYQTRA